ncbi:MAG TPA: prephenate dehydrogenase/arogenate dehydrogenase family protein [Burkholderiales bacterium]
MRFSRVAVIGVGLIGGSFALALKRAKACGQVVGAGRSRANLRRARRLGIIDSIAPNAAAAAKGADLILVAAPVAQFEKIFSALKNSISGKALITDAGSTKRDVIAAARKGLGRKSAQFVPAHPIAGAEKSGAGAAQADLFQNRRVVLTPLPENSRKNILRIKKIWESCGAQVSAMDARRHDDVLAAVSHLPHLLAYTLVHNITRRPNSRQLFSFAAGGFRDFTRIASSHPEMWRDICMANRDRLLAEVSAFTRELLRMKKLLEKKNATGLEQAFARARKARDQWIRSS